MFGAGDMDVLAELDLDDRQISVARHCLCGGSRRGAAWFLMWPALALAVKEVGAPAL
jgi:hypothetical protein